MSTTEIKWKPGSPGRKPAWTKGLSKRQIEREYERRKLAGETDQKTSSQPDSFPGNSSNVQEIPSPTAKEVKKDPSSPDEKGDEKGIPNPFYVKDSKGGSIPFDLISETPPPKQEIPPWEDEAAIAALAPFTGYATAWIVELGCALTKREAPTPERFKSADLPSLSAQVLLCWVPDIGSVDPRYMITGRFVMGLAGLVMTCPPKTQSKPKQEEPAPRPANPPPPRPAPPVAVNSLAEYADVIEE